MSLVFKVQIQEVETTRRYRDFVVEAENEEKAIEKVKAEIESSNGLEWLNPHREESDTEIEVEGSDQIIYAMELDEDDYFVECDLDSIKEKLDNEDE